MNSFLIDECLSPKLVAAAQVRGYLAAHLVHLRREGTEDWAIAELALRRDAILVTNNGKDFLALYARFDIHPGLVIILPSVGRAPQIALFGQVVDFIEGQGSYRRRRDFDKRLAESRSIDIGNQACTFSSSARPAWSASSSRRVSSRTAGSAAHPSTR